VRKRDNYLSQLKDRIKWKRFIEKWGTIIDDGLSLLARNKKIENIYLGYGKLSLIIYLRLKLNKLDIGGWKKWLNKLIKLRIEYSQFTCLNEINNR
jgi:hypothetical protein